jgi:PmbA protein
VARDDPLELAGRALGFAETAGAEDAEAWVEHSSGREIRVHDREVESLEVAGEHGAGVRAWVGKQRGYAYGTDLSEAGLRELAEAAVAAAQVAEEDEFAGAPEAWSSPPAPLEGVRDPSIADWTTPQVVELAKRVEAAALARKGVESVEQAVYVDADGQVALKTSRGREGGFEASQCYAYLQALAGEDGGRETGLGFGVGRAPGALDPDAIGAEAGDRAVEMLGAGKPGSRTCPIVLADTVAASFLGFIGAVLCADAVQRGRSPFAGRLGDEVASEALTLADDGLADGGLASAPFDGEGTPQGRTELIGGRKLLAYLHDTYTARREGAESTGNAARGSYRSAPDVGTSNLIVAVGESKLEDLLATAADGVYVTDVAGLHSGVNPVSGQFSVGASGRLIRGGGLADPVREFTIASDLVTMLSSVSAVGAETRWVPFGGSVRTPAILIGEMSVGGA